MEVQNHEMTLRLCSRSKDVIEPLLKPQWYVNMKDMAAEAYKAVDSGELIINPKFSETEFKRWMENIRDWCISRQLWWGHQAPVYYVKIEGETQSVCFPKVGFANVSLRKENGGFRDDQKKKLDRKHCLNFPGNHLHLNEITMSSILGFPLAYGHGLQWAGQITYVNHKFEI